ncbi:MAG: hypothetical protein K0S47_2559 [Herbinix sp.]|jgi:hypothetical protein|nr:hypothetical protein [Herbinix sp.]
MKRVLAVILCLFIFTTVSCSSNQDKSKENTNNSTNNNVVSPVAMSATPKPTDTSNSTIFYIDNETIEIEAKTEDGKLPDFIYLGYNMDEKDRDTFIKAYLQERGIEKEEPDGVSYYNGKKITEYYRNDELRKVCFVLRPLGDSSTDGCFCVTLNMDDMKTIGNISYRSDQEKDTVNESLYDTNGKQTAQIAYRYAPYAPFPLITEFEDENNYIDTIGDVLYRSQKFWLYERLAKFDEAGKWIGYDGDIYQPDSIKSYYTCSYDSSGKLIKIEGDFSKSNIESNIDKDLKDKNNEVKSDITLCYQQNGKLDTVKYQRSPLVYGTTDQTGEIHYDEAGRILYEDSYITHGTINKFYLYKDDERTPWACISIDSMPYGRSERDGVEFEYGNYYFIYLFQPS